MNRTAKTLFPFFVALMLAACGATDDSDVDPSTDLIPQTFAVSKCGGFVGASKQTYSTKKLPQLKYCDAEVLKWSHDAKTGELKLANNRILLNCCGERIMKMSVDYSGVHVITETDSPEMITTKQGTSGARCGCMCVFDMSMAAQKVAAGPIQVKLVRDVTDDSKGAQAVWSGTIDLSAGSGTVVLNKKPVMMGICAQP